MVTKGVCHGQSPGAASTQEDVVGAAEIYPYTSAAPTMSSVRGAGAWNLRSPPGSWAGGAPKARGSEWYSNNLERLGYTIVK